MGFPKGKTAIFPFGRRPYHSLLFLISRIFIGECYIPLANEDAKLNFVRPTALSLLAQGQARSAATLGS